LSAGASPQTPPVELTALPRLYFGSLLLKGGEERGKGERRRGRREKVRGRGEFVLCPRKKKEESAPLAVSGFKRSLHPENDLSHIFASRSNHSHCAS